MANRKISELPTKNTPDASDFMPLVDTSGQIYVTKKATLSSLVSGLELVVLSNLDAYLARDGAQTAGGAFTFSNSVTFSGTVGGSGLSSYVTGKRLDEFAAPTANVGMNNQRLTGLASPVDSADAVTKAYVDTTQITAGAGLTKTGNIIDIETASANRIVINSNNIDLATTGVTAGTYGGVTVDEYGRVTAATNNLFGNGAVGSVVRVGANGQLSISATISATNLPTTGVSAGTYTSVTVDVYGRVTAASNPVVVAVGKTFTVSNTMTLTAADSASVNLGAGGTVVYENSIIDGGAY